MNNQRKYGIIGIILGFSVWLTYIFANINLILFLMTYLIQMFLFIYYNRAIKTKRWYLASLITLCVSNLTNCIVQVVSYFLLQNAINQYKGKNLIASEQFGAVVIAVIAPVVYQIMIAISVAVTLVVFIECSISYFVKRKRLFKI